MNRIEITDFNTNVLDIYARLNEAQLLHYYEPDLGIFIAESPNVIMRALHAGYEPLSFLMEDKQFHEKNLAFLTGFEDVPIYTAPFEVLSRLTGFNLTRGMLCAMRRKGLLSIEEICENARRIAVLEDVVNPTNVGAIFRSAAALNMDAVILTPACSDPLYRRASRVSMGTVFQIPWTYIGDDTAEWQTNGLSKLKRLGFKTAAMALCEDSVSIDDPALMAEDKLAIILGTEGDGLKDTTISGCDYTVCIPMSHGVDSLNVAAASAVAFWQLGNK